MQQVIIDNNSITPSKVVCVGRNYVEHIKELNNEASKSMIIFNKPNSAITNNLQFYTKDTRFEAEICFLIKDEQINAIGFGLDLTKADIQNNAKSKGLPWEKAKSFDGSAVLSQFVSYQNSIQDLRLELFVNDKLVQFANYNLMIYKPNDIIKEIKTFMTLEDGDIIMSGTPKGVNYYKIGDIFIGKVYTKDKLLIKKTWQVIK